VTSTGTTPASRPPIAAIAARLKSRMRCKVTWEAWDKASMSPLGAAITLRGGEKPDDPLRAAVLIAVTLALDQNN